MRPRHYNIALIVLAIFSFFVIMYAVTFRPADPSPPVIYTQKTILDDGTVCAVSSMGNSVALTCNWSTR